MIWNSLRRHPVLVDIALVSALLLFTLAPRRETSSGSIALALVETLPLLLRRRHPLVVLAVVAAAAASIAAVGPSLMPLQLAAALYTVAVACERRVALLGGLAAIVPVGLALASRSGFRPASVDARLVLFVAAWLLGESVRSRRAYVLEIEEKAARLEREREARERQAVAEEQARIAREIHDVVAHSVSVVVVQAAAADDVFELEPERAREALRAIEATARSALRDLRRVLGVLRDGADYEPQPGLDRLDRLVRELRATGLDVAVAVEGEPRWLPAAVDLSAYRIVQEALTNTLRHAGARRAEVRVRWGDELGLEIRDDGNGVGNGGSGGYGLVGMRERVATLGGEVHAGPADGGGFAVSARIPIGAES